MVDDWFVGTDIVSVPRIADILKKYPGSFRRHAYSPIEVEYCDSMPQPDIHYAGRFAAKEAVKKALLASGAVDNLPLNRIEIIRSGSGAPLVRIDQENASRLDCKVSIAHTGDYATATALLRVLTDQAGE
ncbi:MAG: holo-ACP synthase [Candidatus Neomarinimicrobiota bacterium]